MSRVRIAVLALAAVAGVVGERPARAGGFDIPDIGTEALGRGGAFAAKADTPLALYYNPAGLAQQRGTNVQLDVNLVFHDMAFTRDGNYDGMKCSDLTGAAQQQCFTQTPWAGQPYPTIHNAKGFGYQPFLAVTTDAGYFKRWTFSLGVVAPPGIGMRQYGTRRDVTLTCKDKDGKPYPCTAPRYEADLPANDNGRSWNAIDGTVRAPAPSRYDIAETNFTILTPTLAAAFHALPQLDVGAGIQWVVGEFNLMNANLTPLGQSKLGGPCGASGDDPSCDSYGLVRTTVQTVGFLLSALAHPVDWVDVGVSYRPQININSSGTIHPYPTPASPTPLTDFPATFSIKLPHIVRGGVRIVSRYGDGSERADLELDATYENWAVEDYARVRSDNFLLGQDGKLAIDVPHLFKDTYSVRVGGAYNFRFGSRTRLALRGGLYYDSPTTDPNNTHLDTYTQEKVAVTLGLGLKYRGVTFNAAYAGIWMPTIDTCATAPSACLRAASANNGTNWSTADPTVYVSNGRYEAKMHTLSLGVLFQLDDFAKSSLSR